MAILLAASAGGHISQLHTLRPLLGLAGASVVWATFRTPQTESLLAGEDVEWFDYIPPRGAREILRGVPRARDVLRRREIERAYSTGSGIALAIFPVARMAGVPCTYIESAARSAGPSMTGRIVSRLPGVEAQCQYRSWAGGRWSYRTSVFEVYRPVERTPPPVRRVLVTMGTIRPFGFERLLRRVADIVPAGVEVLCQVGETRVPADIAALPHVTTVASLPSTTLVEEALRADVVIAHAGIGSALMALDAGHCPILVSRRASHGEHIDDHQEQIAAELDNRGLAFGVEVEDLTWDVVLTAAGRTVAPRSGV